MSYIFGTANPWGGGPELHKCPFCGTLTRAICTCDLETVASEKPSERGGRAVDPDLASKDAPRGRAVQLPP